MSGVLTTSGPSFFRDKWITLYHATSRRPFFANCPHPWRSLTCKAGRHLSRRMASRLWAYTWARQAFGGTCRPSPADTWHGSWWYFFFYDDAAAGQFSNPDYSISSCGKDKASPCPLCLLCSQELRDFQWTRSVLAEEELTRGCSDVESYSPKKKKEKKMERDLFLFMAKHKFENQLRDSQLSNADPRSKFYRVSGSSSCPKQTASPFANSWVFLLLFRSVRAQVGSATKLFFASFFVSWRLQN